MTALFLIPLLLAGVKPAGPAPQPAVKWEECFEVAQLKARKSGKPMVVDFWAGWCGWCDRLNATTYVEPSVVKAAQDFVAVKVDTEGTDAERAVAERYEVTSLPTILFLSPEGRQLVRVNGFQSGYVFSRSMKEALSIAGAVIEWEQALARDPGDARALGALGEHLYETGMQLGQQQCLDEARELLLQAVMRDHKQPIVDRRRSRMLLAILENADRRFDAAERLVKDALSLKPGDEDDAARLLFVLGRTYLSAGRTDESVATFQIIVREYPQSPLAQKARETLVNLPPR